MAQKGFSGVQSKGHPRPTPSIPLGMGSHGDGASGIM